MIHVKKTVFHARDGYKMYFFDRFNVKYFIGGAKI